MDSTSDSDNEEILELSEIEEIALHNIQELSQETVPSSFEELPQNIVQKDPAPQSLPQKTTSYSDEEQPSVSTTIANPASSLETQPSDDEYGDLNSNRKRSIKGFEDSKKWDKSITKVKRLKGEEYLGNEKFKVLHDIPRPAREIGPRCTSTFCTKSKIRGCSNLSDDERQIFQVLERYDMGAKETVCCV
ncbi:unnamed protein product [Euphydryas editha]|uniref:Uncharacterized protein n=1 Tax=Euphydryas editha TaxID=104508 RepID=A0AAU9TZM6_EUPED|nr:unnamed protein product [Euphydryas editha]